MVTCRPDTEVRLSAFRRATGTGDGADFPRYRAARVRSVAQLARAPVSKTGGCGFESLHSCQYLKHLEKSAGSMIRMG